MRDLGSPPALLALGETLGLRGEPVTGGPAFATRVALDACASVHLYTADRSAEISRLEADARAHTRRALNWLHEQRDHPWEHRLENQAQLWVGTPGKPGPSAEEFQTVAGYWGDGVWRPPRGGLWTTSAVDSAPSPWAQELAPGRRVRIWRLAASDFRVYEVNCAQDWRDLVTAYPRLVERTPLQLSPDVRLPAPLYLADFEQMSNDWDGMRITMSGKVRGYFVPMEVSDGYTLLHGAEGAEETLWLRWVFESAIELSASSV